MNKIVKKEKIIWLTPEGRQNLQKELNKLKHKDLLKIHDYLHTAREHGDFRENIIWESAQEYFNQTHKRINEIEEILKFSKIIKPSRVKSNRVRLGSTVTMQSEDGNTSKYILVSSVEANPDKQKISMESPIGKGLKGKSIGDQVTILQPNGVKRQLTVIAIK